MTQDIITNHMYNTGEVFFIRFISLYQMKRRKKLISARIVDPVKLTEISFELYFNILGETNIVY